MKYILDCKGFPVVDNRTQPSQRTAKPLEVSFTSTVHRTRICQTTYHTLVRLLIVRPNYYSFHHHRHGRIWRLVRKKDSYQNTAKLHCLIFNSRINNCTSNYELQHYTSFNHILRFTPCKTLRLSVFKKELLTYLEGVGEGGKHLRNTVSKTKSQNFSSHICYLQNLADSVVKLQIWQQLATVKSYF